jgi:hypothetical protein
MIGEPFVETTKASLIIGETFVLSTKACRMTGEGFVVILVSKVFYGYFGQKTNAF